MDINGRVVGLSVTFGLVIWGGDALIDAVFFYPGSFFELLLFDIPAHELFIRTLILGLLVLFGLIVGNQTRAFERSQADLRRFKKAADAAAHAFYITDPEGTIEYVNPAFEEITGYSASEAIGANPRMLKSGEMSEGYYEKLWNTVLAGDV